MDTFPAACDIGHMSMALIYMHFALPDQLGQRSQVLLVHLDDQVRHRVGRKIVHMSIHTQSNSPSLQSQILPRKQWYTQQIKSVWHPRT